MKFGPNFGATISSDGWSDAQRRPILNFMELTQAAASILKSINCTTHIGCGLRGTAGLQRAMSEQAQG